jgi:hypothetical protein
MSGVLDAQLTSLFQRPTDQETWWAGLTVAAQRHMILDDLGQRIAQRVDIGALTKAVMRDPEMTADIENLDVTSRRVLEDLDGRRESVLAHATAPLADLDRAIGELADAMRELLRPAESTPRSSSRRRNVPTGPLPLPTMSKFAGPIDGTAVLERLHTAMLSAAAVVEASVTSAIESETRIILNRLSKNLFGTRMDVASIEGLAQVVDADLEIETKVATDLANLLRRMKGGSVGLAGPRGVGKSTVIRQFVEGRVTFSAADRPKPLAIAVSAPVAYDGRDFMLHLYALTCKAAGAKDEPAPEADAGDPRWARIARRLLPEALPYLLIALILGALASLAATIIGGDRHLIAWGVAALLGVPLLWSFLTNVQDQVAPQPRDDRWTKGVAGIAFAGAVTLLALGILAVDVPPTAITSGCVALAGAVLCAIALSFADGEQRRMRRLSERKRWMPREGLEREATYRLQQLRFQQSYKTSVNGKFGAGGFEFGAMAEQGRARNPMSFPEIVNDFQDFLRHVAASRDVLIAVDELDKLSADADTADKFLNDLKALFGLRDTYFLVSVSEDAMSRFERRGLPFRDVFDSTFDEIVQVTPFTLADTRRLLAGRVVGMPYIFSGLCHALAGGIPRDVIRTARRVVEIDREIKANGDLAIIVRELITREFAAKVRAVEVASHEQRSCDCHEPFLKWLVTTDAPGAVLTDLTTARVVALPTMALTGTAPSTNGDAGRRDLLRLASEMLAYQYFMASALEFFTRTLSPSDVLRAVIGTPPPDPWLEHLARARMGFGISAYSAWDGVVEFRSANGASGAWTLSPY